MSDSKSGINWWLLPLVAWTVFVCLRLANVRSELDALRDAQKTTSRAAVCECCNGTGHVTYTEDSDVVKFGWAVAGEEYRCPICNGEEIFSEESSFER